MNIDIKEQKRLFEDGIYYRANDYMLTISNSEHNIDEHLIASVDYCDNEIIVCVREQMSGTILEKWLDSIVCKRCVFNRGKNLDVQLVKLNPTNKECAYTIKFKNARLKSYKPMTLTYSAATINHYILNITYSKKEYESNLDYFTNKDEDRMRDMSIAILENSNKMLDEVKDKWSIDKFEEVEHMSSNRKNAYRKKVNDVKKKNEAEIKRLKTK